MENINKYMYEGKFIGRVGRYKDKVRTFCQNPSGFVSTEVYDHDITLVNGHSYKEKKSTNTILLFLYHTILIILLTNQLIMEEILQRI